MRCIQTVAAETNLTRAVAYGHVRKTSSHNYDHFVGRFQDVSNSLLQKHDRLPLNRRQQLASLYLRHPSRPDPDLVMELVREVTSDPHHRLANSKRSTETGWMRKITKELERLLRLRSRQREADWAGKVVTSFYEQSNALLARERGINREGQLRKHLQGEGASHGTD